MIIKRNKKPEVIHIKGKAWLIDVDNDQVIFLHNIGRDVLIKMERK